MAAKVVTAKKTAVKTKSTTSLPKIDENSLISFISGTQTNIGRETFYNMKDEQRQAMVDQHLPVLSGARLFYTLMSLSQGVNDVNRQLISWNLIENTIREDGLKPHEHSPTTKWENEVILQVLDNMPIPRVLDLFVQFQDKKVTKKRAIFLVHEYLKRHERSWDLWAIKYRVPFKRVLRHVHIGGNGHLKNLWRYLKYDEKIGVGQLILDYEEVRSGNKEKLGKLPSSVAEGFMTKFKISKEDFWKLFDTQGGQFTTKEKRTKATSVAKAGVDTGFDLRKAKLFDALVYLRSKNEEVTEGVEKLLKTKAKDIAKHLSFNLHKVGLILDTSKSMEGTKDQPYHPMLRAMAIKLVLEQVSSDFKEYRTNQSSSFFPKLGNQSNYAEMVLKALKDGCQTIVIVGDGYENSPFEGATHAILYAYKQKLDRENKLMVLHFNPVFAAESLDVRSLSSLASFIGVREVESLNESMFLAIAKQKPMFAIQKYLGYLTTLQNEKAKLLMPNELKKILIEENTKSLES